MEEESVKDGRAVTGGRLDMSHGFVQHIRRNQIARDDYDKEMKEAKENHKPKHTPVPARPRKPDQPFYRPHHGGNLTKREHESVSRSSPEPDPPGSALFCLEYEADGGQITSVTVHKLEVYRMKNTRQEDDPELVTAKICSKNKLDPLMKQALTYRIREEMAKRRVQR